MKLCKKAPHSSKERAAPHDPHELFEYIRHPACKRLINQIVQAQRQQELKSIAVLSHYPGEGKTLLIAALAIGFMSMLDKRVLVLDTVSQTRDESFYYRGIISSTSIEPNTARRGCIDLITSKNLNRRNLLSHQTKTQGINNSEVPALYDEHTSLDSADFQVGPFVDSMKSAYDLILLDTCALSQVQKNRFDPLILAYYADSSILLMSQASLERRVLNTLRSDLKRQKIQPLGIVIDSGLV